MYVSVCVYMLVLVVNLGNWKCGMCLEMNWQNWKLKTTTATTFKSSSKIYMYVYTHVCLYIDTCVCTYVCLYIDMITNKNVFFIIDNKIFFFNIFLTSFIDLFDKKNEVNDNGKLNFKNSICLFIYCTKKVNIHIYNIDSKRNLFLWEFLINKEILFIKNNYQIYWKKLNFMIIFYTK